MLDNQLNIYVLISCVFRRNQDAVGPDEKNNQLYVIIIPEILGYATL